MKSKIKEAAEKYAKETIHDNHPDCFEERCRTAAKFTAGVKWHQSQSSETSRKLKEAESAMKSFLDEWYGGVFTKESLDVHRRNFEAVLRSINQGESR